jgi:hypothetical protein
MFDQSKDIIWYMYRYVKWYNFFYKANINWKEFTLITKYMV